MPLREDLLTPIPGDNPSGINLRYDPITDKIKEARREDLDAPQGDWQTQIKTADYAQVIKLGTDLLAKKGKDLQIAVWLVEAHINREGFPVIGPSFRFTKDLLDQFWDTLYPEMEDGELDMRAAPLDWLGNKLEPSLKRIPITSNKLNWNHYQESRFVGYEKDANTPEKIDKREALIKENKISAEQFDEFVEGTSGAFYQAASEALADGLTALAELNDFCELKFGDAAPSFIKTRETLEELAQTIRIFVNKKGILKTEKPPEPEEEMLELVPQAESFAPAAEEPAPLDFGSLALDTPAEPEPLDFGAPIEETPVVLQQTEEAPAELDWSSLELPTETAPSPMLSAEITDTDSAIRQIVAACKFLRSNDPINPAPYLILRALRWGELRRKAPPVDSSQLEAPSAEFRVNLKKFAADYEWDNLLETAEEAMAHPSGRGWLDLQRYAVVALEGKGAGAAARAVKSELRTLLKDIPDLIDATLPDDTPAANAETKNWIERSVKADTPPAGDGAAPVALQQKPPILDEEALGPSATPDVFEVALDVAMAGRMQEALELVSKALATERCGRGRFRRKTQMAHLLMAGGHAKVAQPILDQLSSEIEQRKLEDWEPGEAIAYPLELLFRTLGSEENHTEKRNQLYARICKMDPLRALNCST